MSLESDLQQAADKIRTLESEIEKLKVIIDARDYVRTVNTKAAAVICAVVLGALGYTSLIAVPRAAKGAAEDAAKTLGASNMLEKATEAATGAEIARKQAEATAAELARLHAKWQSVGLDKRVSELQEEVSKKISSLREETNNLINIYGVENLRTKKEGGKEVGALNFSGGFVRLSDSNDKDPIHLYLDRPRRAN